jgi:putative ABC transport system permease protein
VAFEIVGVFGPDFRFYHGGGEFDIWIPISHYPAYRDPSAWIVRQAVGRLKPGVTVAQAKAELETLQQGLDQKPGDPSWAYQFILRPLREDVAHEVTAGLYVLSAAVGFVLLIACANLANLLLTRGMRRSKEIAIRAALGAGRGRLVRQLLTESLLLAALGGTAAMLIAHWGVSGLLSIRFERVPRVEEITVDPVVMMFTALAAVSTGILVGLIPALRASRLDPFRTLKEGGTRSATDFRTSRVSGALVAGEVALCLVLLTGAGLMIRLMIHLTTMDIGFDRANLLVAQVSSPHPVRDMARHAAFYDEVIERVRTIPGVRQVGLQQFTPLVSAYVFEFIEPPGQRIERSEDLPHVNARTVSPGYFAAMRIPVLHGRTFAPGEGGKGREVVVISETMARQYFPDQNPVGQTLIRRAGKAAAPAEIVGVVGDVTLLGMFRDQRATLYKPYTQGVPSQLYAVVRTEGDLNAAIPAVRSVLTSLNRTNAVGMVQTMDELWLEQVAEPRFYMLLLASFAALALLLSTVGLYGVISHSVAQRTHEIGVRLALGAERSAVVWMVLRQGLLMTLLGVVMGLAGSVTLTRFLESLLQDVSPTDPVVFASVSLFLLVVALLAAYLPARRASRIDPMQALRFE